MNTYFIEYYPFKIVVILIYKENCALLERQVFGRDTEKVRVSNLYRIPVKGVFGKV